MFGLQYRIAVHSLRINRMRTTLTTLGIIIGVASITLVLALGGGAQNTVRQQVQTLNNNVIVIKPGQDDPNKLFVNYNPYGVATTTTLTETDLNSVRLHPNTAKAAPLMLLGGSVKTADSTSSHTAIVATSPELAEIVGLTIEPGQFLDNETARETAVIGHNLALELYGTNQVLGQQLSIKGRPHTVVGVVKETKAPINLAGIDIDHAVFVSFDDGKSFNQGIAQIQQIIATAKDASHITTMQASLDASLFTNHNKERDFTVLAGEKIADYNDGVFRSIVLVTALVATITLVVGGIGIMNIMLVGVSERTREIGIRKALGATNNHIMSQFLFEALIMCIVGGFLGLLLGYGLAFVIATSFNFQPALTWQIAAAGLGMAFATGILFGLYPALKAARKDPIESLRQYQ